MSTFANRVRELRGSESQTSFANTIGIHAIQYSKYERGVNAPSIEVLERICRVHACSANWLLGLPERSGPPDSTVAAKAADKITALKRAIITVLKEY